MPERNVKRKLTLCERFGLWGLRRQVKASRKRLLEGRGDLLDELMVRGWDDPEGLGLVAKTMAKTGITAQEAVDAIGRVSRAQSCLERTD